MTARCQPKARLIAKPHGLVRTYLKNSKSSLTMRLSPLLALWVPELDRAQAGPRHAEIRGVEDIARLAVHVDGAVPIAEDLQSSEFTALLTLLEMSCRPDA
jgi:hypothetical protein